MTTPGTTTPKHNSTATTSISAARAAWSLSPSAAPQEYCPDCWHEGVARKKQSKLWCSGYCQKHARAKGYTEPGCSPPTRRPPSSQGIRMCPICERDGTLTPAQKHRWCRGHCQKHARALGFIKPGSALEAPRKSALTQLKWCPDCFAEGVHRKPRTNRWCQGFCWHHASARGLADHQCSQLPRLSVLISRNRRKLQQLRAARHKTVLAPRTRRSSPAPSGLLIPMGVGQQKCRKCSESLLPAAALLLPATACCCLLLPAA